MENIGTVLESEEHTPLVLAYLLGIFLSSIEESIDLRLNRHAGLLMDPEDVYTGYAPTWLPERTVRHIRAVILHKQLDQMPAERGLLKLLTRIILKQVFVTTEEGFLVFSPALDCSYEKGKQLVEDFRNGNALRFLPEDAEVIGSCFVELIRDQYRLPVSSTLYELGLWAGWTPGVFDIFDQALGLEPPEYAHL